MFESLKNLLKRLTGPPLPPTREELLAQYPDHLNLLDSGQIPSEYHKGPDLSYFTETAEFYYRLISEGDFFVNAGYSEYEFQHAASSWRDAYSYQAYSGIRFPFAGRARGRISFGYKKFVPRTAGRKGFSGLVADTQMEFRLNRFNFRAGYIRDNRFSIYSDMYYFIEDRLDAGISFYPFSSLRLDYDFRQGRLDYPEAWTLAQPDGGVRMVKRKDSQRSHAIGLTIRLFGNTGLGIQYSSFEWRSDLPGYTIQRHMVGANLSYEF